MSAREWALIIFTIFGQMSVGAFVVLGPVHFFAVRKAGAEEADRLSDRALLAIGPVLVLGMLASLFHLGTPLNAYRSIANFETSWLSREILFGVLFAVLGGGFAIMQWRKLGSFALRNVIALVTAVVGLALVYSMSQVYALPTQPAWDTWATPISFFVTTFLLGSLAMGAAFVANSAILKNRADTNYEVQQKLLRDSLRWISLASILLLGAELIIAPLHIANLAASSNMALESVKLMVGEMSLVLILRLVFVFVGAGVFGVFLYQQTALLAGKANKVNLFAYSAFALVLVAEVLGRFLFYATHIRIGI